MKKALIFSLIFHVVLFSIAFLLKEERKEQKPDYFYTRIITPNELKGFQPPSSNLQKPRRLLEQPPPTAKKSEKGNLSQKNRVEPDRKTAQQPSKTQPPRAGQTGALEKQAVAPEVSSKKEDFTDKGTSKKQDISGSRSFDKFDKDVIAKLAQKDRENKPDSSITFSTKEYQYQGYMQRLKEKIEGIWKYPADAAAKGIYGDLYIRFTIKKDGRLGAVDLIRTSGYKSLDDAAIRALRDAEPYWPLPDEWGRDGLTITGHFVYTHYGSYIR